MPTEKLKIIAEAIFNSKLRYGISIYLKPRLSDEDELSKDMSRLQILQNDMLRTIIGKRRKQHVHMKNLREEMRIMSVNQMAAYHVLIETYNILNCGSVDKIKEKIISTQPETNERQTRSSTRGDLKFQKKPSGKGMRFSYTAPLLWNKLPEMIRNTRIPEQFKFLVKLWIWEGNIPA